MENNNNLFTNMFGVESEDKPEEQLPNTLNSLNSFEPRNIEPEHNQSSGEIELPSLANQPEVQPVSQEEVVILDSVKEEQPDSVPTIDSVAAEKTNNEDEDPSEKKSPAVIIFLMIALIGGGLLMFVTTFLESIPNDNNKPVSQEEQTTTIINQEETKPATITSFNTTFEFEKGYTENKNELNKTVAFTPEKSEGIIKCENIEAIKTNNVLKNNSYYIYYKDYKTKKIIMSTKYKYGSNYQYNTYTDSLATIKADSEKHENITIRIDNNNVDLSTDLHILVDLAYGNAFEYSSDYYTFEFPMNYNTEINTAMNKLLSKEEYKENMQCSTIITN